MKSILFKEEMFKAVLDGRKTQTRRIIKKLEPDAELIGMGITGFTTFESKKRLSWNDGVYPRYNKGETVYMKEPYIDDLNMDILYKFNAEHAKIVEEECAGIKNPYKNKLFMPESAARYFIKITDVRVERLQDISEEDARLEGVITNDAVKVSSYKYWFAELWKKINGKESWNSNPYVFVYEFELIK